MHKMEKLKKALYKGTLMVEQEYHYKEGSEMGGQKVKKPIEKI